MHCNGEPVITWLKLQLVDDIFCFLQEDVLNLDCCLIFKLDIEQFRNSKPNTLFFYLD